MRDLRRWLSAATRSLAVDIAGRERRQAARSRIRTLLVDLLVLGCVLLVALLVVAVAGLAIGVTVSHGQNVPVVVTAWTLLMAQLAFVPLVAMRVGTAVYTRLG
ncbi:hypothetical protein [Haloglomus halophilum]|uniref:hypothetical protein n=1 Tax=Haloglomus halophilum TaxID=2962672 RepID=UPI0020C9CE04|nr:hypothetical protein [Haloglomus halophilum]